MGISNIKNDDVLVGAQRRAHNAWSKYCSNTQPQIGNNPAVATHPIQGAAVIRLPKDGKKSQ